MNRNKSIIFKVICVVSCFLLLYNILPYLYATSFVMPSADDFGFSNSIKEKIGEGKGYFVSAVILTLESYFTWQGTYFCNFLLYLTAPFVRYGIWGIRGLCFISILFFYVSLYYLVKCVMENYFHIKERLKSAFLFSVIVCVISNLRIPSENYFWYNGVCAYTIPLTFALLGVQFLIKYIVEKQKNIYWWAAIFLGIAACGGTLQHAAFLCYVYLCLVMWAWKSKKLHTKKLIIAFGIPLLGAIINVCAPGNFVRHGSIGDGKLHMMEALNYAIQIMVNEIRYVLFETDMIVFLLVIIAMGYVVGKNGQQIKARLFFILLPMLCGGLIISNFPVALGYSSNYMEPRGYFVLDTLITIGVLFAGLAFGSYFSQKLRSIKFVYIAGYILLMSLFGAGCLISVLSSWHR